MTIYLTIMDQGVFKTAMKQLPEKTHICPGMNLILECKGKQLRVPIEDVDIKADDGSTVVRIDPNFESIDLLLTAPEMEWFSAPA